MLLSLYLLFILWINDNLRFSYLMGTLVFTMLAKIIWI